MREHLREHLRETAMRVNKTLLQRHLRETRGRLERSLRCIYETYYRKTVNIGFRKLCDVSHTPENNLSPSCNLCSKKHSLVQFLKKLSFTTVKKKTLLRTTLKRKNMTLLHKSQPLWCNSLANHSLADHSHPPVNQPLASLHLLHQTFSSSKLSCATLIFSSQKHFVSQILSSTLFYWSMNIFFKQPQPDQWPENQRKRKGELWRHRCWCGWYF